MCVYLFCVYLFRAIQEFAADLDMLAQILKARYSYDPDVKQWSDKYCGQYYGLIQQYLWNLSDLQREFSSLKSKTTNNKQESLHTFHQQWKTVLMFN